MPTLNDISVEADPKMKPKPKSESAEPAAAEGNAPIFNLPEEVAKLPVVKRISIGSPPAVRVEPGQHFPELKAIEDNIPDIVVAGLDFYQSKEGDSIMFNPLFIGAEELKAADAAGRIKEVIPSYSELMGKKPTTMSEEEAKKQPARRDKLKKDLMNKLGSPTAASEGTAVPPATAKTQNTIAKSRLPEPQSPTSGPRPGAGRIINNLLERPS